MDAMLYEDLIKLANNCGRDGSKGAETCFYNNMEMAEENLSKNPIDVKKKHEFYEVFSIVRCHVRKAIEKGLQKIKSRGSESEKQHFEDWILLLDHRMYDRKKLDEIIDKAHGIFSKHNLGK